MIMEKFEIKTRLYKKDRMKYFSQIDMVKILERAMRRTDLPYYITKGFTPRVKMSFGNALKLGIEGETEVTFYFNEKVDKDLFVRKFVPQLPPGLIFVEEKIRLTE